MKKRLYPNFTDYFYYNEGDNHIRLVRKIGHKIVYRNTIEFDTSQKAATYFEKK